MKLTNLLIKIELISRHYKFGSNINNCWDMLNTPSQRLVSFPSIFYMKLRFNNTHECKFLLLYFSWFFWSLHALVPYYYDHIQWTKLNCVMDFIKSGIVTRSMCQVLLASTNVCNQSKMKDLTTVPPEEAPKISGKSKDARPFDIQKVESRWGQKLLSLNC